MSEYEEEEYENEPANTNVPMDVEEEEEEDDEHLFYIPIEGADGQEEEEDDEHLFHIPIPTTTEGIDEGQNGDDDDDEDENLSEQSNKRKRNRHWEEEDENDDDEGEDDDIEAQQTAYYLDEYGDGNPDLIRLRQTGIDADDLFGDEQRLIDEDIEEEEHVAGMILPKIVLDDEDVYYRELTRVLCAMGKETTRLLEKLLVEKGKLTHLEKEKAKSWIKYWTIYMVENYYTILGKIVQIPTGPNGDAEYFSGALGVMGELWRIKLIVNFEQIGEMRHWKISDSEFLMRWLVETPGVKLDCPPRVPVLETSKGGVVREENKVKYEKDMAKYKLELEKFENTRKVVDTPIMMLRQKQIMHLVQFVTGKLHIIPYHEDIRRLIEYLELKNAMLFCQSMPGSQLNNEKFRTPIQQEIDNVMEEAKKERIRQQQQEARDLGTVSAWRKEYQKAMEDAAQRQENLDKQSRASTTTNDTAPSNTESASGINMDRWTVTRDYWIYCTHYFYPLLRALYYVDVIPKMNLQHAGDVESYLPEGATKRLEEWMVKLAQRQGDKYFDRLEEAADEAMSHPGDMDWMLFRHPEESTNTGVVIRKVRGEDAYLDYHEQTGLSYAVIMGQVNDNVISNVYVLELFDRFMNTYKQTHWREGYVIPNAFIDENETMDKWKTTREPLLIQIFSGYWLMLDNKILPITNIYTSICMWMLAIRKTRTKAGRPKDCLIDNTFIGDIIDNIILGKENILYLTEENIQKTHDDSIRRGIPVNKTRVKI